MANSPGVTQPFHCHPIELGPQTLGELSYGYQHVRSLLLRGKTSIQDMSH